jgi:hypothetical protein
MSRLVLSRNILRMESPCQAIMDEEVDRMVDAVVKGGGDVIQFAGDCVIAVFAAADYRGAAEAGRQRGQYLSALSRAAGQATHVARHMVEERDVFVKAQLASLRALVRRGLLLGLAAAVLPDDDAPTRCADSSLLTQTDHLGCCVGGGGGGCRSAGPGPAAAGGPEHPCGCGYWAHQRLPHRRRGGQMALRDRRPGHAPGLLCGLRP